MDWNSALEQIATGKTEAQIEQENAGENIGWFDRFLTEVTLPSVWLHTQVDNLYRKLAGYQPEPVSFSYSELRKNMHKMLSMQSASQKLGTTAMQLFMLPFAVVAPIGAGTQKLWNIVASTFIAGNQWWQTNMFAYAQDVGAELKKMAGLIDEETYAKEKQTAKELQAQADRDFLTEQERLLNTNYSFAGLAVVNLGEKLGLDWFKRKVKYITPDGNMGETNVDAWSMTEDINKLTRLGYEVIDVQETPRTAERWATIAATIADLFDVPSNMSFGWAMKGLGIGSKFIFSKTSAMLSNNAVTRYVASTPYGSAFRQFVYNMEGKLGIVMTQRDRLFSKIFAPLNRRYNSKIEMTRRFIDGIDDYIFNDSGLVADMATNAPDKLKSMFGKDILDALNDAKLLYKNRLEELVNSGLDYQVAKETAKREFQTAQAYAMWAQTGLPFDAKIIENLKRKDITPEEAFSIISVAKEDGLNETEANALSMLLITGKIERVGEIPEAFIKLVEKGYREPALRIFSLRNHTNLLKVENILKDTDNAQNIEELAFLHYVAPSKEIMREIDATLPFYKRSIRNRLAVALSVLEQTTDPAERQAITDYVSLFMAQQGVSLRRLKRILKKQYPEASEGDLWFYLRKSISDLLDKEVTGDSAEEILSLINQTAKDIVSPTNDALDDLNRMLLKAKEAGLGENVGALIRCSGGYILNTLSALLDANQRLGDNYRIASTLSLPEEESVLRRQLLDELLSKGYDLSYVTDAELRRWLSGEVQYTRRPITENVASALRLIYSEAEDAGISPEYLNAVINMQRAIKRGILQYVSEAQQILTNSEVDELLRVPQNAKQLLDQIAKQLDDLGRTEDVYVLQHLGDKLNEFSVLTDSLLQANDWSHLPSNVQNLIHELMKPITMFYHLGKQYSIQSGRDVMLMALHRISNSTFGDLSPFSPEPTLIHTVRLTPAEHGVPEALEGVFTTPYVANVLKGLVSEKSVWRGWLDFINTIVKMSAVVWSPMVVFRDFVSNAFSIIHGMNWRPEEWFKVATYYGRAWNAIKRHNEDFLRMAEETPSVWGATVQATALHNELYAKQNSGSVLEKMLWKISNLPVLRNLQYLRGWSEGVGKLAMYYAVEDLLKRNSTPQAIMELADDFGIGREVLQANINSLPTLVSEKYLIDYHDVTPAVQFLRRYLGLFPFITWESKMFSNILSDAFGGRRLSSLGYVLKGIRTGQRVVDLYAGNEPDEAEQYRVAIKQMLPERLKNDPFTIVWRDRENQPNVLSLAYYLPYSVLLPLHRLMLSPDKLQVVQKEAKQRLGGVLPLMVEILLNRDLFTGKPIYDEQETFDVRSAKVIQHLGKEVLPLLPKPAWEYILRSAYAPTRITEDELRKSVSVKFGEDWLKAFLGIYQIKLEMVFDVEYERKIRRANNLLNTGWRRWEQLISAGKVSDAQYHLQYYIREANRERTEAYEMLEGAWKLANKDIKYFSDPSVGFNPLSNYGFEIKFLRDLYDFMRQENMLPQNTSKMEIMDYLLNVGHALMQATLSTMGYVVSEEDKLQQVGGSNREQYRNYRNSLREVKTGIPLPPPMLYEYTPNQDVAPFTLPAGISNQTQTVDSWVSPTQRRIAEDMRNVMLQTLNNPPSLGFNLRTKAGRPAGGDVVA